MEFLERCRLCLCEADASIDIYGTQGIALNMDGILSAHLCFQGLAQRSTLVCLSCWTTVEQFHRLYTMVKENTRDFELVSIEIKPIKLEDSLPPVTDDSPAEILSIDKTEEIFPEPLAMVVVEEQQFVEKACRKRAHHVKNSVRPKKSMLTSSTKTINNEKDKSNADAATIKQYFHMNCDLCGASFDKFEDCRGHHMQMHHRKGYLECAICTKRMYRKVWALQHCMYHENPDAFKCETCGKQFEHSRSLSYHERYTHAPQDMRNHKCSDCPRTFMRKHLLNAHFKQAHTPDEQKKFECYICHQKFNQRSNLLNHISRVHENGDSCVCAVCARFFKCSISYERHYRNEHTNLTKKVQCTLCGNWLKHSESLREHMRRHQATAETCSDCGHVSANIKAMRAHKRTVHAPASLPCTVCGKMFKKPQTLKEHMAIHTGRTDLYSCKYCTKTFRSSANMYAHRKRAHPVEYASTYDRLRGKPFDNTKLLAKFPNI